jgi:hypothetical protein
LERTSHDVLRNCSIRFSVFSAITVNLYDVPTHFASPQFAGGWRRRNFYKKGWTEVDKLRTISGFFDMSSFA